MSESVSRTFIGSVVCVDLVGYSKRSVAQQITVKEAFNRLLAQVLERIPEEDRIILDTGDGAAISFLGDPEQSLAVGLALRDVTAAKGPELGAAPGGEAAVRMGINLGPVKIATDMNGYPKIVGDGLNVAERIMAFARPGQIAVSRSFFEMVSRLSDENAKLFRLEGSRTDKNAREHQVYVIDPGVGAPVRGGASGGAGGLVGFLEDKLKVGATAALLLALILGEAAFLARKWRAQAASVAAASTPAPAVTAAPAEPKAPAKAAPAKPEPAPKAPEPVTKAADPPRAVVPLPAETKREPAKPETAPQVAAAPAKAPEPKAESKAERARREEPPKPAADAISPVAANLLMPAPLNFPPEAAARGLNAGQVRARLTLDAAGNVTRVQVLEANPPRFFDEEARRSLRDWKFDKGPANRQYIAEIEFKR